MSPQPGSNQGTPPRRASNKTGATALSKTPSAVLLVALPTVLLTVLLATLNTAPSSANAQTLGEAAAGAGIRLGVAVDPRRWASNSAEKALIDSQFASVTPENDLKWTEIEPINDEFDFADSDSIVEFAHSTAKQVRGHTLVWGSVAGNGVPSWARDLEPSELRAELLDYIHAVANRYKGRIDRYDVVNEPLAYTSGGWDTTSPFPAIANPPGSSEWIDMAFSAVNSIDPDAELWLNETAAEFVPAKADALVALVEAMIARGVPIHGVGIQGHLLGGSFPTGLASLLQRLGDLGVATAITELDIAVDRSRVDKFEWQAELYRNIVQVCLDAPTCEEVTVWGLHDGDTWLDSLLGPDTQPLLFDANLNPKPAYAAILQTLIDSPRPTTAASASTSTTTTSVLQDTRSGCHSHASSRSRRPKHDSATHPRRPTRVHRDSSTWPKTQHHNRHH